MVQVLVPNPAIKKRVDPFWVVIDVLGVSAAPALAVADAGFPPTPFGAVSVGPRLNGSAYILPFAAPRCQAPFSTPIPSAGRGLRLLEYRPRLKAGNEICLDGRCCLRSVGRGLRLLEYRPQQEAGNHVDWTQTGALVRLSTGPNGASPRTLLPLSLSLLHPSPPLPPKPPTTHTH